MVGMSPEPLETIIRDILGKVKQHRDYYESNEAGVCQHLVLPMLKTLGWNPESDEVSPQPSTEEGRPDYELIKEGKRMLFIEAKKLGTDVSRKEIMRQMGKYAYDVGIEFGLLTNGVQWFLFRSFEKGKGIQERKVWDVNLETDAVKKVIRNLRTIAKDNIDEMDELIEKMNALEEKWKDLLENKEFLAVTISELLLKELSKTMPHIKFELDEIKDFASEKIEGLQHKESTEWTEEPVKPLVKAIKIGADSIPCNYSYEILLQTAEWIIKHGRLKPNEAPLEAGHKRYLVNREKTHKSGENFRAPKKLSNGLWIELSMSTQSCIRYARELLEHFGFKEKLEVYGF
jgi:predicted type IV restriction endonuclease